MEQNLPVIAKKVWSLVRVMLKKGINSKRKFLVDLNMMMKRGKIAGKAIQNLMFHHHHNWAASAAHRRPPPAGEYLFSSGNAYSTTYLASPETPSNVDDCDEEVIDAAIMKALEMLKSATASPELPEFGKRPMMRQLTITDSAFPLRNGDEDCQVDEAAEKFITRFYNDLRRQD